MHAANTRPTTMREATPDAVTAQQQSALPADTDNRAPEPVLLEKAVPEDVAAIRDMVIAAYAKYIPRIGREPAPMTTDYRAAVRDESQEIYVLRRRFDSKAVGSLTLVDSAHDNSLLVHNLVVDPAAQGRGYGSLLMAHAEKVARSRGRSAMVLHTNEKMYENIAIYPKMGFDEVDRRTQDGYHRVFFKKTLT